MNPAKVMSWVLSLQATTKIKSKTKPTLRLEQGFAVNLLVLDLSGPQHPCTTYMTLETLKYLPKRARKKLFRKNNLVVPVEKMSELVKKYPKEVGSRRCNGHIGAKLTREHLEDYARYLLLNLKKGQLKVKIGRTDQPWTTVEARAKTIVQHLRTQGYTVRSIYLNVTRGPARPLTI